MSVESSHLIKDVLRMKSINSNISKSMLWGTVNLTIFSALVADMYSSQLTCLYPITRWISLCFMVICLLNTLYYTNVYLQGYMFGKAVEINNKQKSLFSISNADVGFNVTTTPKRIARSPDLSQSFSEILQSTMSKGLSGPLSADSSQQSPFRFSMNDSSINKGPNISWNNSGNDSSIIWPQDTSGIYQQNKSWGLTNYNSPNPPYSPAKLNCSYPSMNNFNPRQDPFSSPELLNDFHNESRNSNREEDNQNSFSGSFWSYSNQGGIHFDQLASLKKNVYQPAQKDSEYLMNTSSNKKTDSVVSFTAASASQIWQKRGVSPQQLFKFEENMRIWISMNILHPLIKMISDCNQSLSNVAPDIQIGSVGIDKLKKAVQNISTVKQLRNILPFLEITVHQDYLVRRLQDLAKGGAMSNFKWNSGGRYNGKEWRDEFPTDSYIVIHLFALYMDNHLPPDPTLSDGRLFSNLHLIKTPEKPCKPPTYPSLYMVHINPPDFKVILPQEGECEVGSGHKNCLHALILFCHYMVHQEHSHLAGINLQLSGINLAWVVSSQDGSS